MLAGRVDGGAVGDGPLAALSALAAGLALAVLARSRSGWKNSAALSR